MSVLIPVLAGVAAGACLLGCVAGYWYCFCRKRRQVKAEPPISHVPLGSTVTTTTATRETTITTSITTTATTTPADPPQTAAPAPAPATVLNSPGTWDLFLSRVPLHIESKTVAAHAALRMPQAADLAAFAQTRSETRAPSCCP